MFLSETSLEYRLQICAVFPIKFSLMHQVVCYCILKTTIFLLSKLFGMTKQIAVEEKAVQVAPTFPKHLEFLLPLVAV